jgi:hypothetical protein
VRDPDYHEGQHVQRSQTEQTALKKVTSEIRKSLTIKPRAGRPAHADRNHKQSAHSAFPHILRIMRRVMELARQEEQAFDTGIFIGRPFEA